jgi:AcrR family transcriptional regulator
VTKTAERPLRRDAARNHERLVASARTLFAAEGLDVSVEEITRHAGVGMGTLYRHFPTKEELIDAVLEDAFADLLRVAEEAAADEDGWAGFTGFLEHVLELHAHHRGVKDILASREHGAAHAAKMRARILPLVGRMVERAQAQGTLRGDLTAADLPLIVWSAAGVIDRSAKVAPNYWRRYFELLLDGLRAGGATPLSQPPLTRAQLARIRQRRPM